MRKIRIAQIGVNRYSHALPIWSTLCRNETEFEVAGYALVEDEREQFADLLGAFGGARELTLEEIWADPSIEAVAVETEEVHLTRYAQLAAAHGRHVHMEKPGGTDLAAFERLIETVRQNGTVFHTGYMYCYNPFVEDLIARVRRGELGEICSVEAQMNCRHPRALREWLAGYPGGMMFFLGCHLIDLILQLQGLPERVLPLNRTTGFEGVTAVDSGLAVLEYPRGVSFAKTCDVEIGGYQRRQLVVTGTKGTVELKPLEAQAEGLIYTEKREYAGDVAWDVPCEKTRSPLFDRYEAMMSGFAAMVRGERENPWTLDYELALYRTILRCCGVEAAKKEGGPA